jgi:hypothetical protein
MPNQKNEVPIQENKSQTSFNIISEDKTINNNNSNNISLKNNLDAVSTIKKIIGTGENAKNSFVYIVLKWSFLLGAAFSIVIISFLILNAWNKLKKSIDILEFINCIKDTWTIFTPLITLALGYAFGKSRH